MDLNIAEAQGNDFAINRLVGLLVTGISLFVANPYMGRLVAIIEIAELDKVMGQKALDQSGLELIKKALWAEQGALLTPPAIEDNLEAIRRVTHGDR